MFLLIIVGMCRLFGFHSSLLSGAHRSLVAADNALARQSGEHPDGWGVAHYEGGYPHLIRGDKQALEDGLFKEVSGVVTTRTLLAHVRRATVGEISVLNCHPFQHGPWTFAHNGELPKFKCGTAFYDAVYQNVDNLLPDYLVIGTGFQRRPNFIDTFSTVAVIDEVFAQSDTCNWAGPRF